MSGGHEHTGSAGPDPTGRRGLRRVPLRLAVVAVCLWSVAPFLWELTTSLQPDANLLSPTPHWLPIPFTTEHYRNVLGAQSFGGFVLNSVITSTLATIVTTAFAALAAFALTRLRLPGKGVVVAAIMGVSMFPHIAIVGPLYVVLNSLGILDTYGALIGPYVGLTLPLVVFILYGQFRSIPPDLDEAAYIDGAGKVRCLVTVLLPVAAPGLVTAFLLGFISCWNDLMIALAFTSSPAHQTIPVGIANFTSFAYDPVGDVAAAATISVLPLVVLTLFFQRRIAAGLASGAVKE